jgi:hypothetical protein
MIKQRGSTQTKRAPDRSDALFGFSNSESSSRFLGVPAFRRLLRLGDNALERLAVEHVDVGQHLAVEGDGGELQRSRLY